jgi:hypothetical protein
MCSAGYRVSLDACHRNVSRIHSCMERMREMHSINRLLLAVEGTCTARATERRAGWGVVLVHLLCIG